MKASEFKCGSCGTGRVVSSGESPKDDCDVCGADEWVYRYDRGIEGDGDGA